MKVTANIATNPALRGRNRPLVRMTSANCRHQILSGVAVARSGRPPGSGPAGLRPLQLDPIAIDVRVMVTRTEGSMFFRNCRKTTAGPATATGRSRNRGALD